MSIEDRTGYSIGHLENPTLDDSCFESEREAEQAAVQRSYDDSPWGVWDNDEGSLLAIVYGQEIYKP